MLQNPSPDPNLPQIVLLKNTGYFLAVDYTLYQDLSNMSSTTMPDLFLPGPPTPEWLYTVMCVYTSLTGILGVILNSAVIIVFILNKKVSF